MACHYEISMKKDGGVDSLEQMLDWCKAMKASHKGVMNDDWYKGYDMALKGFETKLESLITELRGY